MKTFFPGPPVQEGKLCCLAFLVMMSGYASAQELPVPGDARLGNLSALFQRDVSMNISSDCSQRFPATHDDWSLAIRRFSDRNKDQLAELDALQAQILSALNAGHPGLMDLGMWASVVNARLEQRFFVAHMLAPLNDQEARAVCDVTRDGIGEQVIGEEVLKAGRAATAAAIEDLGKH